MTSPPRMLTVRRDDMLDEDLATLARAGITTSEAVRRAVEILADIHRNAWHMGLVPDGAPVEIDSANIAPTSAYYAPDAERPTEHPIGITPEGSDR